MKSFKKKKSPGTDNIPGEPVQAGGYAVISALHKICNKIWQTGEWSIPQKGLQFKCCIFKDQTQEVLNISRSQQLYLLHRN